MRMQARRLREYEERLEAWSSLCPRTRCRTRCGLRTPAADKVEAVAINTLGRRIGHSQRYTAARLGLSPGSLIRWSKDGQS